ncbi:ABC transporter substrate-binding protein [Gemmatimonas sp.]|uniref:ABC transporter substrate-binding protein n=1 Tax=Gemmatimonas sp. TaxID=1962908 RepID=UPI00333E3D02
MTRGRRLSVRALATCTLLLSACDAKAPPELRVGLIGVFDGAASSSSGMPARLGAQLAVDELNAVGGVLIDGVLHRVRLIDRETANRPDAAAAAARALVNLDSVDVLVGPQFSALALAAGAVAEVSQIPLVAPMASSPSVTANRAFVTRLAFLDADQGDALARFAHDTLGLRRAGVLYNAASDYGRGIIELFGRTFTALGGRIVGTEQYNIDDPGDQQPQIMRLLAQQPDAIVLPNFSVRDSSQVRILRTAGFRGQLLGSDAWDAIALRGREYVTGSIVVGNWDRSSTRPGVLSFLQRWKVRHAEVQPRATAAATYDALRLIARAAEQAKVKSGLPLVRALQNGGTFDGAFARYQFNGTGNPIRGATLLEMRRDSLVFRVTLDPRR